MIYKRTKGEDDLHKIDSENQKRKTNQFATAKLDQIETFNVHNLITMINISRIPKKIQEKWGRDWKKSEP